VVYAVRSTAGAGADGSRRLAEFDRRIAPGHAAKVMLTTADSRTYDFGRLAPVDFAFVAADRDPGAVRTDTLGAYAALRPGGCLAWYAAGGTGTEPLGGVAGSLGLPEPVHRTAGAEVAYVFKGEGVGATAGPDLPTVRVVWEGEFAPAHSLAAVNRAVCGQLAARGHAVTPRRPTGRPPTPRSHCPLPWPA
jgi:hypothetical protein